MHPCTNPLSSHLAPPSPAPLLLASRAWRCSSGPCSINEPACLMKRTQPVWLGGDGNTNSCCHHRWGITPLHQLPLLIYHTHTHTRTWTHAHLHKQLLLTNIQVSDTRLMQMLPHKGVVFLSFLLCGSPSQRLRPSITLPSPPTPSTAFILGLNNSISVSSPSAQSLCSVTTATFSKFLDVSFMFTLFFSLIDMLLNDKDENYRSLFF